MKIHFEETKILELRTCRGTVILESMQIITAKANKSKTLLYLSNGKCIETNHLLKWYENWLHNPRFFRSHNSYIINCIKIESFNHHVIYLDYGLSVPIGRGKYNELKMNLIKLKQMDLESNVVLKKQ